jgi:hypothetical protein
MSNECSNRIEIIGNKEVITRMFELVKSDARDWGVEPDPNKSEEENRVLLGLEFDFDKVVPYPEEFEKLDAEFERQEESGVPYDELPESGYEKGGRMWCINNWGTIDDPMNAVTRFTDRKSIHKVDNFNPSDYESPSFAIIYYTTSYGPAFPVTAALSKQYPELTFKHAYEEPNLLGGGYQVWKAGNLLEEHEDDIEDYEQEDDYEE